MAARLVLGGCDGDTYPQLTVGRLGMMLRCRSWSDMHDIAKHLSAGVDYMLCGIHTLLERAKLLLQERAALRAHVSGPEGRLC